MTTKSREQRRARMTIVPASSWIRMLLMAGSELDCAWPSSPSSSPSSPSQFRDGSPAMIVPASVKGLYMDQSWDATVA